MPSFHLRRGLPIFQPAVHAVDNLTAEAQSAATGSSGWHAGVHADHHLDGVPIAVLSIGRDSSRTHGVLIVSDTSRGGHHRGFERAYRDARPASPGNAHG